MKQPSILIALLGALFFFPNGLQAQCQSAKARTVAYHSPDKDIVDIAAGSDDFTTLVAAVKAAGLVETLKSEGPFTVFAPTNAAFDALPDGTVETLLQPANRGQLTNVLTYHVVAAKLNSEAVLAAIEEGHGKAQIKTVNGETLTVTMRDGNVYLIDQNYNLAKVTTVDLDASNGVIHVIDTVVIP